MKSELASYHHIYSKNTRIKINFTTNQIKQLTDLLSEKTFYLFSPIDEILENDTIKLLSTSLEYDLVDLNNNSIFINFPDNLLKTRLIQKLLVHIDNKQNINKTTLYKLISFIDFSDSIFGKELNEFVNSNKELLDKQNIIPLDEYTDGIIDPGAEYLSETSFIDNKQFLTEDFDTILTTLTQTEKEKTDDINSFSLKTINGTEKFLINSLNANNKISKIIEAFIIEKGGFLFPKYEGLFFKILNQETYSQNLKNEALAIILEKYQYDSFSSIEYDYFKSLIEKNEFDGDLFDRLLNIKVNYLDHEYVYRNIVPLQLIDINTFINTELGRFLDIIILFNKKNPKINNKTAKILLDIKDNKYREFTQGALFPTNNYIELKSITGNTFQGYSYYYKGFSKDSRKIFESTAKILLETGSVNSINEFNLFFLSLNIINPKVNKIKWEVINLSRMINISLQTKMDFEFEKLWIEEIFSNSSKSDIEFNLTYLLINKSVQPKKFKLLFNILKENIKNYSLNLDIEPIINSIGTNETNETNELLIDTFFLFLDSNKIKSTYYNLNSFKKLMNRLTPDKQKKLANHSHLSIILSIQDIDKIKRIID